MSQTTILENTEEHFDSQSGEIYQQTKRKVVKSRIEPTDEFFKVSRYLNTIFAFHNIPLNLVGISLCFGQMMEFRTNRLFLLKPQKQEIAEMLGCSYQRVCHLIQDCKKYDIIRPYSRGMYEVNGFLFSSGDLTDTRNIQAQFDFETGDVVAVADMKHRITGESVRKCVIDQKKKKAAKQLPGQMTISDFLEGANNNEQTEKD